MKIDFPKMIFMNHLWYAKESSFQELYRSWKACLSQVSGLGFFCREESCFRSHCQVVLSSIFPLSGEIKVFSSKSWHLAFYLCGLGVGELQEISLSLTPAPAAGQAKRNSTAGLKA